MRKPFFYHFKPLILVSKINHKIMFFSKPFLGPVFSHLFSIFFKDGRFGDPLQNPMGVKMVAKISQVVPQWHRQVYRAPFFFKPCFHETIKQILCRWDIVAFKRSFLSMEIGYFYVFVAFLCALFYTTGLSFFFI